VVRSVSPHGRHAQVILLEYPKWSRLFHHCGQSWADWLGRRRHWCPGRSFDPPWLLLLRLARALLLPSPGLLDGLDGAGDLELWLLQRLLWPWLDLGLPGKLLCPLLRLLRPLLLTLHRGWESFERGRQSSESVAEEGVAVLLILLWPWLNLGLPCKLLWPLLRLLRPLLGLHLGLPGKLLLVHSLGLCPAKLIGLHVELGLLKLGSELLLHRPLRWSLGGRHPHCWPCCGGECRLQVDRAWRGCRCCGGRCGCSGRRCGSGLLAGVERPKHLVSGKGRPDDAVLATLILWLPGLGRSGAKDGLRCPVPVSAVWPRAGVAPILHLPQVTRAGGVGLPGAILRAHAVNVGSYVAVECAARILETL